MATMPTGIYATGVFILSLSVSIQSESCSYKFNVWYPDSDVLKKLQVVELKVSNLSAYIDLEILKLKHNDLQELACLQNKTNQLELELIKSKLKEFTDKFASNDSKQHKELQIQISDLAQRLIQLESRISRRGGGGRKSRLKQERALDDTDHVTTNTLRASVSDLRSEWIMIKRDIFDIHKEIAYLKRDHNDVTNLTTRVQDTTETLRKTVDNFKTSLDHSAQTIRILNSNFDTLKQIVSTRNDEQLQTEFRKMTKKVSDLEKQLQTYGSNTSTLEKVVEKMVSTQLIPNGRIVETPTTNRTLPTGN